MSSNEGLGLPTGPPNSDVLIQLHVAEYEALTTRATYLITLMYAIWTVVVIYAALAAQVWRSFPRPFMLWGSGIVLQIMMIALVQLLIEQYQIVRYVEARLRPLVQSIVGDALFWQYEAWLGKGRTRAPMIWEYPVAPGIAVAVIVAAIISWPFSAWDYGGLTVNLVLLCTVVLRTYAAIRTRHSFFAT